VGQWPVGFAES